MELPAGYIGVPLGKGGCVLVLSAAEYRRGIKRGKHYRRVQAVARRQGGGQ